MSEEHKFPWFPIILIVICICFGAMVVITRHPDHPAQHQTDGTHQALSRSLIAHPEIHTVKIIDSPACHCDPHALDFAVLDRLREAGLTDYNSAYDGDVSALNKEKGVRAKLRKIAGSIQDHCLRDAYLHWLGYYDDSLNDAYASLDKQGAHQSEIAKHNAELKEQFAEAERCKHDGTVPILRSSK